MTQISCFGEILLRLSASARGPLLQTPELQAWFGGAEANVAAALARLGTASAMIGVVPDDDLGDAAIEHLARAGVDTAAVRRAVGRLGLYFLAPGAGTRAASVIYDRRDSVFARSRPGEFDWPSLLARSRWLHVSGVTLALGPDSADLVGEAVGAACALGVKVSFDCNYRASLWNAWCDDPAPFLRRIVERSDLMFGDHRDIGLLLDRPIPGIDPGDRRAAAEAAFAAFPRLQAIASTARHADDADRHRLSARFDRRDRAWQTDEVDIAGIVDRIGSGDAFAAGVLHVIEADPSIAARTGLAMAALKHATPGDASWTRPRDLSAWRSGGYDVRR